MSAEEALKYGLIDEIVQPNDAKLKALSMPPPGQAPQLFGNIPADAEGYEFGKIVSSNVHVFSYVSFIYLHRYVLFCNFMVDYTLFLQNVPKPRSGGRPSPTRRG